MLGKYYPWLASCNVIFLDVPRFVRGALWAVGKLMTSTGGAAWNELLRVAETKAWPQGVDDAVAVRVWICPCLCLWFVVDPMPTSLTQSIHI